MCKKCKIDLDGCNTAAKFIWQDCDDPGVNITRDLRDAFPDAEVTGNITWSFSWGILSENTMCP
jgi:hypothetical protein